MDFGWKYYLLFLALLLVIIATIPLYISRLNRALTSGAAREWISAYGGLLAIAAAMIAAIPVFQQLDEARLTTRKERILLTAGAQKALDDERGRVMDIAKLAEDLSLRYRDGDTKAIDAELADLKVRSLDVDQEMKAKTDKPPKLWEQRRDLAIALDGFVATIDAAEKSKGSPPDFAAATQKIFAACESYVVASHQEIEFLHRRIAENETPLLEDHEAKSGSSSAAAEPSGQSILRKQ